MAERRRHARLGERLRRVGRLERARQGAAAGDAAGAAAVRRAAGDGRVDAARRGEPGRARRRLALERRRDDALGAREPRRRRTTGRSASSTVELPAQRDRGVRRARTSVDGRRRRRRDASRRARRCACRRRSCASSACPTGSPRSTPRPADRRLPPARDRDLRRGAVRRGVEAAAAAAARLRRGRARRRRAGGSRSAARGDGRAGAPLTGLDLAEARAYAAAAGARLPTEDEWQLAAEAGLLERREPLVWNWTESEHSDGRTRFAILKGGSDWKAEGSDWYVDGGPQDAGVLAEAAAARRRAGALAADRLPAGGRPAVSERRRCRSRGSASSRRRRSSRRRSPAMLLGDYGADVIKIEHPHRVDPARGHGPSKDGDGLWFKALARNKRLVTLDLSKPDGRDLFLRLAERADVVLENFRPGTLERWGVGWDELSAVNPRLVLARVSGFGQTGPYAQRAGFGTLAEAMSGFAALNGEPDGPPLLPPLALADGVAGARDRVRDPGRAARARADRPRPGRRHVAGRAADDAARPAAHRLRPARRAAAAHRQPLEPQRAAQRLPHGRRRLGRRLGERDLDRRARACGSSAGPISSSSRGSRPAPAAPRTSTRSTTAVAAWIGERTARRGARRVRGGRGARSRRSTTRATSSPTRSSPRSARSAPSTTAARAAQDAERDQPPLRDAGRDPPRGRPARRRHRRRPRRARRPADELARLRADGVV